MPVLEPKEAILARLQQRYPNYLIKVNGTMMAASIDVVISIGPIGLGTTFLSTSLKRIFGCGHCCATGYFANTAISEDQKNQIRDIWFHVCQELLVPYNIGAIVTVNYLPDSSEVADRRLLLALDLMGMNPIGNAWFNNAHKNEAQRKIDPLNYHLQAIFVKYLMTKPKGTLRSHMQYRKK